MERSSSPKNSTAEVAATESKNATTSKIRDAENRNVEVTIDGRRCYLHFDDDGADSALVVVLLEEGRDSAASECSFRIPIREVLSASICGRNRVRKTCSSSSSRCCFWRESNKKWRLLSRWTLSPQEMARFSSAIATADGTAAHCKEQYNVLAIYFITRKANYVWRVAELVVDFGGNEAEVGPNWNAGDFIRNINKRIATCSRPTRLLVFINPYGGTKRALQIYETHAAPAFKLCSISTTVVVTTRADHARDYITSADLSLFDGIVTTGGDGLFNEALNGLLVRTQSEADLVIHSRAVTLRRPNIPIGIIPAGSTNTLVHTIHGTDDVLTAVLHIIIGDKSGVDVCGIYSPERFIRFASTAVSYGFLGDVLKESERLRSFGRSRYILAGIKVWLKNAHYVGTLRYRTSFGVDHDGNSNELELQACRSQCFTCSTEKRDQEQQHEGAAGLNRTITRVDVIDQKRKDEDVNKPTWTIVDQFTHIVGAVTPCVCGMAPKGIGPNCHLGDGNMHLFLVSKIGRFNNLACISKIMSNSADGARTSNKLRMFVVKECEFTPQLITSPSITRSSSNIPIIASDQEERSQSPTKAGQSNVRIAAGSETAGASTSVDDRNLGSWNIDGELLAQPAGSIYLRMHRQLITLFARGIEEEAQPRP